VRFGGETLNVVLGVRAVRPFVGVRPEADLELQPAQGRLFADEAEHFQVPVALGVIERHGAHLVARNVEQIRIGEMQVIAHDVAREIIAQTEGQAEAIETIGDQGSQIIAPEGLVVIPAFVLHVADEGARDAAHGVGGLLLERLGEGQGRRRIAAVRDAVGQFRERVNITPRVRSGDEQSGLGGQLPGREPESLAGRGGGLALHHNAKAEFTRFAGGIVNLAGCALGLDCLPQFSDGPFYRWSGYPRAGRIRN
jgi:hypothetical protein